MTKVPLILLATLALAACRQDSPESIPTETTGTEAETAAAHEVARAAPPPQDLEAVIEDAVTDPDRLDVDFDRDEQRKPRQVLAFAGIGPGMHVLDVFTGGGYYAELLSRVVGEEGEVWAFNPRQFYERFGSADLDERLAGGRLPNVTRHDRPIDDLALPDDRFDAVMAAMVFHDLYWLTDDVPAVLREIHAAMKPGGVFVITDHAAPEGTGAEFAQDFNGQHRIEEAHVVDTMEAAGFELVASIDVLRVPEDDRTKAFFAPEMRGRYTDRFVLKFRKPLERPAGQ